MMPRLLSFFMPPRCPHFFPPILFKMAFVCGGIGFVLGWWLFTPLPPFSLFLGGITGLCLLLGVAYLGASRLGTGLEEEIGALRRRVQRWLEPDPKLFGKEKSLQRTPSLFSDLASDLEALGRLYWEKDQQSSYLQSLWRSLLESLGDAVLIVDEQFRLRQANPSAQFLLKVPLPEAVDRPLKEVISSPGLEALVSQVLQHQRPLRQEWAFSYPDLRIFDLQIQPLRSPQGEVGGALLLLKDITREHRLTAMRHDFIANASHELRTPATSIKVMVESLLSGGLEDKELAVQFLTAISRSSERLVNLVEDLLTLAEAESRARPLAPRLIPVSTLFEKVAEDWLSNTRIRKITLHIGNVPSHLTVYADPKALSVILDNLLDNAIKYTPEGGEVYLEVKEEGRYVHLMVRDTGIGIPPEHLPRIWERFYRVDRSRSRELGGTGLGLSIVKHLTEQQKGYVWVRSRPGEGSCFGVAFPKEGKEESTG